MALSSPTHDVNDDVNGSPVMDTVDESQHAPKAVIKKPPVKKSAVKKTSSKKPSSKKSKKSSSKTKSKQTFLKAPPASKEPHARPIYGTPDPNVDEPSEMITAIKNKAQDQFWDGKRPYPEQLRERGLAPPPAPVFTGSMAQKELQKRGTLSGAGEDNTNIKPETARSNTLRRVSQSEISGVTFDDQPLRLSASEPFRRSLDTVSFELGRPCKNQEYLGWPLQQSEQSRVDRVFEEVNEKMKLRGYDLQPRKARSVGSDVAAFTADNAERRLLGIWSAGDVGLLLLMCDSETPRDLAYAAKLKQESDAAAAKKAKPKTGKAKKKNKKRPHGFLKTKAAPMAAPIATEPAPSSDSTMSAGSTSGSVPPSDPNAAPLGTRAPQAEAPAPDAPLPTTPSAASPLVPAPPEDAKPQVIPGAPSKSLPPEPAQSAPQSSTSPSAPNPSSAFIPADVPAAKPDSMKALPPDMPKAPPVTDVKQ